MTTRNNRRELKASSSRRGLDRRRNEISLSFTIAVLFLLMSAAIGCGTGIRKQAPAVHNDFPNDGPNYFPSGPEFKLSNQIQAMEQYKLEREKLRAGLDDVRQVQICVDNVQYIPAGPDFQLTNQEQALHEYEIERETLRAKAIHDIKVHLASDEEAQ